MGMSLFVYDRDKSRFVPYRKQDFMDIGTIEDWNNLTNNLITGNMQIDYAMLAFKKKIGVCHVLVAYGFNVPLKRLNDKNNIEQVVYNSKKIIKIGGDF